MVSVSASPDPECSPSVTATRKELEAAREPMTRRRFLSILGIGVGAAAVGGVGIADVVKHHGTRKAVTAASTDPLQLAAQTYTYADFSEPASGLTSAILAGGIVGQGADRTIIDLTGPIQTQFPRWQPGDTTQYNVIRIEPAPNERLTKPVLSGFTLRVSAPQVAGALFNGIRIARCDDLLIEDVRVVGVPGTGNQPPFETFGIDLLSCASPVLRRVVVDGLGRGGAGIGLNTSNDALIDTCTSFHNQNSHGFAIYRSQRVTFVNCVSNDNGTGTQSRSGAGFNHEESEEVVHIQSTANGNSLASYRFLASGTSTSGHRLIRCTGDGSVLLDGQQKRSGISLEDSDIAGGFARA